MDEDALQHGVSRGRGHSVISTWMAAHALDQECTHTMSVQREKGRQRAQPGEP